MAKNLGPTFGDEIIAAGLGGKPLAWGATDDTITGREHLTSTENTTLDGVIAAHDPTKQRGSILTVDEFIGRFTNAEYRAAVGSWRQTAGNAKNWDVVLFDQIDFNKKKSETLKTSLVTDGILTQERADEIFA